jgi:hypothetical protein
MKTTLAALVALSAALTVGGTVMLGPYQEVDDAGSNRNGAQIVPGRQLAGISGNLEGALPGQDFEDCYIIRIVDPPQFSARTDTDGGGFTEFDSQLWLFSLVPNNNTLAFGLLAADEIPGGPAGPTHLPRAATDTGGGIVDQGGLYMIGITAFNRDPISGGGIIFDQALRTEVSSADGPGGGQPHTQWVGPVDSGEYLIAFTGASGVDPVPGLSPPGQLALAVALATGAALTLRRRLPAPTPVTA